MRKLIKSAVIFTAAVACITSVGCSNAAKPFRSFSDFPEYENFEDYKMIKMSGIILNADATLTLDARFGDREIYQKGKQLWDYAVRTLTDLEDSLSTSLESSYVYAFNAAKCGETVEINRTCYQALTLAKQLYEFTDGYFNPAVYYSVDLYGLLPSSKEGDYPKNAQGLPEEEYVSAFRRLSTFFTDIELSEKDGTYTATKPQDAYVTAGGAIYSLKIDLGGIGKGYASDLIYGKMRELGFEYGMFDFGSSSMSLLSHRTSEGGNWHVGLTNPRKSATAFCQIDARDTNLSSSGDYEKYVEIDGKRYCHIIDPSTGSPIDTGVAGCTVIGGSAAECDALSTAICAMGKERAVEFINEKLDGKKVIFVCDNGGAKLEVISNCIADIRQLSDSAQIVNAVDDDGKIVI